MPIEEEDVAEMRETLTEIAQTYNGYLNIPGTTDDRRETYPAISCLMMIAVFQQSEEQNRLLRRILRAVKDDDD